MTSKKNIGILSYWGFGRGMCNVTLNYVKMLKDDYNVFILKQLDNPIEAPFDEVNVNVTEHKEYIVDKEFFKKWIVDNKLDAIFFNEYQQWTSEPDNLVKEAKALGCKVYAAFLTMERYKPEQTYDYDRIFCPTVTMERLMRQTKIRKFTYVPYSIDLQEFPKKIREFPEDRKFRFFHPGGFGGVQDRKQTREVIEAFRLLDNENIELIVTSQKPLNVLLHPKRVKIIDKNISREELIKLYYESDCTVLPSKWESIGIPILESLAAGVPVITMDQPPMNEFVNMGKNGYLCNAVLKTYPGISVYAAEIEARELKSKMESALNKYLYPLLSKNSRFIVEEFYDLEKNKHYLLDFLKEELK